MFLDTLVYKSGQKKRATEKNQMKAVEIATLVEKSGVILGVNVKEQIGSMLLRQQYYSQGLQGINRFLKKAGSVPVLWRFFC